MIKRNELEEEDLLLILFYTFISSMKSTYTIEYTDGHESKPANSNFSNFFYLINSKVIPFYTMC